LFVVFALCGCETRSLTLKEKRRLRVFKNGVLGRIFGSKRDEVRGEWRKLQTEKFYDLYFTPKIIWLIKSRTRWAGHVASMGEESNTRDCSEERGVNKRRK
jgi:hypothetical protein